LFYFPFLLAVFFKPSRLSGPKAVAHHRRHWVERTHWRNTPWSRVSGVESLATVVHCRVATLNRRSPMTASGY
jgi:hypothetical protein